jgi:hypothetical protein
MQMNSNEEKPPYVVFELRAVEDRNASVKEGRYIAKDVIFAQITRPGSRDTHEEEAEQWLLKLAKRAADGIIPQGWVSKFSTELEAFKKNETLPEAGTPIKGWQIISPAVQTQIIRAGFRTVEDLAAAPEVELVSIGMGGPTWREKARAWIAEGKEKGASAEKVADLTQKVTDLTALVEKLVAENAALAKNAPKTNLLPAKAA